MTNRPRSLYVHIPFCDHLCSYCDFCKVFYREDWAEKYIGALLREIEPLSDQRFQTIYVGGGTPSSLSFALLEKLVAALSPLLAPGAEFTFEANPESFDAQKARLLASFGVNRLSFGIQTSHEKYLKLLGRKHSFEEAKRAIETAKEAGLRNINGDLMFALPGQSNEEFKDDLEAFLSLGLAHYSCYSLILEEGTIFSHEGFKEADEDTQADMYETMLNTMRAHGYRRYEVSNFARPGFESRHNQVYWRDQEYYGVGLGASGYVDGIRYTKTKNLTEYINDPFARKEEIVVDQEEDRSYYLLCNLRLEDGFALEDYKTKYGEDFFVSFPSANGLIEKGLLLFDGTFIKPSDRGMLLLDAVLVELFQDA